MKDAATVAHQATSELRLDNLEKQHADILTLLKEEHECRQHQRQELSARLKKMEDQLSLYALSIRLFKGSCYIALIIVGLKVGSIAEIWKGIFNP